MIEQIRFCDMRKFEKNVAKIYILLLSVRMITPLVGLKSIFYTAATNFDFVLHVLGFALMIRRNHGVIGKGGEPRLFDYFVKMVFFLNISSIIMSIILQIQYGYIGSDSAVLAAIKMSIYWTQYIFIILYNREVFRILSKDEIRDIIEKEVWCLLFLGYMQLLALKISVIGNIYDKIDFLGVFLDSYQLTKLPLTGAEGASTSSIIGIFVFPFLLSGIVNRENVKGGIIQIFLWIPVILGTNSSSTYICVLASVISTIVLYFLKNKKRKGGIILLCVFILGVLAFGIFGDVIVNYVTSGNFREIKYLIFEKAFDMNNGSTVSRLVPIITNWGAFKEYPILGVGNGCQGYFYLKYFPTWVLNVAGTDVGTFYEGAKTHLVNGALFFPSILSGYGIVGTFLVICYIRKTISIVKIKVRQKQVERFGMMYFIAMLPVLLCGLQGEFVGNYLIWFVLSIPYMV